MSFSISVSLFGGDHDVPAADVTALDDGRQFISLRFGNYATVLLPDFDAVSAAYARALAAVLMDAASRIEAASTIEVVPPSGDVAAEEIPF